MLNPAQRQAVEVTGHCLITAPPGSGKTTVLKERARFLLERYPGSRLMGVTFTSDAAKELEERIRKVMPDVGDRLIAGTFHALCLKQLQEGGHRFQLLSDVQQQALLRRAWTDTLDEKERSKIPLAIAQAYIEGRKAVVSAIRPAPADQRKHEVFEAYQKLLAERGAADFNDLLAMTVKGMAEGTIAPYPVQFALIDEFQDTDAIQFAWARAHWRAGVQTTIVGDDDQSIFSWRGALALSGMLAFKQELNATHVNLNVTYRCAREIIAPAAKLIEQNAERVPKTIQTANRSPGRARVIPLPSRDEEVRSVVSAVISSGVPGEWGILSRTNKLLDAVEQRLTAEGVAVSRKGGTSFWEGPIPGFVLSVFASLTERNMLGIDMLLKKAGVGEAMLSRIHHAVGSARSGSLDRFLALPSMGGTVGTLQAKLAAWDRMLRNPGVRAYETDDLVVRGVGEYLKAHINPFDTRRTGSQIEDGKSLMMSAVERLLSRNGAASKRLSQRVKTLQRSQDEEADDRDKVKLMTLHASKGLEFPFVWIIGVEEGVLPSSKSVHFDEERRLFYVGITRAIREVTISHVTMPERKVSAGARQSKIPPSRFIAEAGLGSIEPPSAMTG